MNDFYKRLLQFLACLLVILLICLGVTQLGRRFAAGTSKPTLSFLDSILSRVHQLFWPEAEAKRAEREAKLTELLADQRSMNELKEENRQLREQLKLDPPADRRAIYARVLLRDPVTWNWQLTLSKGERDGIRCGNPVLFEDVLIGKVTEVFQESAKVSTIASPECKFSVFVVGASGEEHPGILQGIGAPNGSDAPLCQVDYLAKRAHLQEGDLVITSGLGTEFPYGIPVGNIQNLDNGQPMELVDNARIKVQVFPAANFHALYYVTILTTKENKENTHE